MKKSCQFWKILAISAMFGNITILKLLSGVTKVFHQSGLLTDEAKTNLIRLAVESDSPLAVEIIENIFSIVSVEKEIIEVAHSRRKCKIIEIVDPNFKKADQVAEKYEIKDRIIKILEAGESSLDVLPNNKDFEYVNRIKMISELLPDDRNTTIVTFDDLLEFHVPPVHIDDDELTSLECRQTCSQHEYCGNIKKAVRIAEYIKEQLGVKDDLFKLMKKPMVLGSMRENTKLFSLGFLV